MNNFALLQQKIFDPAFVIEIQNILQPVYKRFFQAIDTNFQNRSLLDIAVLLRQVLLIESFQRGKENLASLRIPIHDKWPKENEWKLVGIHAKKIEFTWEIYAEFWIPVWLNGSGIQAVDYFSSSDENIKESVHFHSNTSDIFLEKCGTKYLHYSGSDQQKAIRSTLALDRGQTLAISLPTGEGKSLVFKSINSVGFYDTVNSGLTVVIVPTVTLALDQEKNMQFEKNDTNPYAYVGKREIENKILKDKIINHEQDICFVSPEAAYGPLRQALLDAAKNGKIKAIVVDEAHIIDEWGTGFRHEYQLFSGLWRQLLELSPNTNRFRTILLSATFTQESIDLVKTLYSFDENSFELYSATKLRPEVDYWISEILDDESIREQRVIDAVHHLPRPLILYTTEVRESEHFYRILQKSGFKNIAIINGQPSSMDRNNVVEAWRNGELDVVVATSAFGLGIDYPHTRSIVHACIPETLSRFYQEVGRGGRDGKSSISLILPTKKDLATAKSMNKKKFISNEKGYDRWKTMFNNKKKIDDEPEKYIVDLGSAPSKNIDYSDQGHNRDWNTHVILLMVRAKLLQLVGIPSFEYEDDDLNDYNRYIIIRILDENHLDQDYWNNVIHPIRTSASEASAFSLNLLLNFLKHETCPADIFGKLYELVVSEKKHEVSLLCSNCLICRGMQKKYNHSPLKRAYPKLIREKSEVYSLLSTPSALIEYQPKSFDERLFKRSFHKVFPDFVKQGIQNFIFVGNSKDLFLNEKVKDQIKNIPIYIELVHSIRQVILAKKNLPLIATVIVIGFDVVIDETLITLLNEKNNIVFLPKGTSDPYTVNRVLSDIYKYQIYEINELINKVAI